MKRGMEPTRVRDLMTVEPFTLGVGDTLAEAHDMMESHHVRHIPVLDDSGDLKGLLTERDLLRSAGPALGDLPVSARYQVLSKTPIEDVMIHAPETVSPDDDLISAAQTLLENKFGCLPVVGESAGVEGILTESDFVRFFAEDR